MAPVSATRCMTAWHKMTPHIRSPALRPREVGGKKSPLRIDRAPNDGKSAFEAVVHAPTVVWDKFRNDFGGCPSLRSPRELLPIFRSRRYHTAACHKEAILGVG